jgi:hypothetical protein
MNEHLDKAIEEIRKEIHKPNPLCIPERFRYVSLVEKCENLINITDDIKRKNTEEEFLNSNGNRENS